MLDERFELLFKGRFIRLPLEYRAKTLDDFFRGFYRRWNCRNNLCVGDSMFWGSDLLCFQGATISLVIFKITDSVWHRESKALNESEAPCLITGLFDFMLDNKCLDRQV